MASEASENSTTPRRSGSLFRKRNNHLFNFHSKEGRTRSSTVSSIAQSLNSLDDHGSPENSICATVPVYFSVALSNKLKHANGKSDYITEFPFNEDEDYKEFLKEPKYIKTFKKSLKTLPICRRLFLAQELNQNEENDHNEQLDKMLSNSSLTNIDDIQLGPNDHFASGDLSGSSSPQQTKPAKASVWALKFNKDGKYLATAGKGNTINVWKVLSSPLDRLTNDAQTKTPYASVFQPAPLRKYQGHTHDVLSIDWSKNDFLLSSSMDKTVKLWNIKKDECLRTFSHGDFVTSVKFHPTDDRFFVSGCLDHKVRLWSILENDVSYEFDASNFVTAVSFTPNGNLTIVGTFTGAVYFLDTQNLELRHSIQLNKKRSSTGAKITGIETYIDKDDIKVLITSNDSKVRLVSLRQRQLEVYFKGSENTSSQIIATISDDNKYVISGSENHYVYLWSIHKEEDHHGPPDFKSLVIGNKKKRNDSTSFHAHHSTVTCAVVAPLGTQKTLSLSNDFIYEVNTEVGKKVKHKVEGTETPSSFQSNETLFESSSVGSILVTADDTGIIRVFRQDIDSPVRKFLIENNKSLNKHAKETAVSPSLKATPGLFINKHANVSAHSLIARSHSFKKLAGNHDTDISFVDSSGKRSRGALSDSTPITSVNEGSFEQGKVKCEICDGDKFTVRTAAPGTRGGIVVVCNDCGNQINPANGSV